MVQMPAPIPPMSAEETPMAAPMPMSDEEYKTGLKEQLMKLYAIGTETMKKIIIDSDIKENKPNIKPIEFDSWYDKLYNDLFPKGDIKDTSRFNKIIQYGNFDVSQPTGGFNLKEFVTPEFIKEQYVEALKIEGPVLLVITEPFSKDFFKGVQGVTYEIIGGKKPCGLLYNNLFKEKYSIEEYTLPQKPQNEKEIIVTGITAFKLMYKQSKGGMSGFRWMFPGKSKTSKNNIVAAPVQNRQAAENLRRAQEYHNSLFKSTIKQTNNASMISNANTSNTPNNYTNKQTNNAFRESKETNTSNTPNNSTNGILIVNFHGDSKGDQKVLDMFHKLIEISQKSHVHFILGDSNITSKKTNTTIEQVLNEKELKRIAYSTQKVEKTREYCDILKNNQLDKYSMTDEIDGMFAVDLKYESTPIPPKTESVTAFKTKYTLETPMLGDHSVVGMKVTPGLNPPFTLLSATGTSMDHPTKGIFKNEKEWGPVMDMTRYHEDFGKPYTLAWINVYNQWEKGFIQFVKQYGRTDQELKSYNKYMEKIYEIYKKETMNQGPTLGSTIAGGSKRRKAHKSKSKRLSKRKQVRKRSRKAH